MATYEKSFLLSLYRDMVRIRAFEEHAAECFTKGMLAGNIHLSIGQEAAEAGAFAAIEPRDYFTSTHRGHGHAIARGADPKRAMAELFGKAAGYCKGKGGSMHIADMEKMNHLGANGIVGAGQPISAGSALASKIMGDDSVTVGWFGSLKTTATACPRRSTGSPTPRIWPPGPRPTACPTPWWTARTPSRCMRL